MKETLEYNTIHELMVDLGLIIRPTRIDKWRVLYPNSGQLEGFPQLGTVQILCTDGTEAYFHVGRDTLFHGHLRAFTGPIAKTYVWEQDWDYTNHKRKVSIFCRADGSIVVIPRDKDLEEYRKLHPEYCPIGQHQEDSTYKKDKTIQPKKVSKRQELLATL